MNNIVALLQGFLTFVRSYCLLPLIIMVSVWGCIFKMRIWHAAWDDIRNPGTDVRETMHMAHVIYYERWSRRDPATIAYVCGLASTVALVILSLIYG